MTRSNSTSTLQTTVLTALLRGSGLVALALGLVCAAPQDAKANSTCTQASTGVLIVDVSYDGNFYSVDGGIWVGGMSLWEVATATAVSQGSVDVLFNFYSGGTLTVDQYDYDYNAGDSMVFTFDVGEQYYVGANVDTQRAIIPMPPLPKEPDGPLPQNDVVIAPKTECGAV